MFPVFLTGQIAEMNDSGEAGTAGGRCWFTAPFNCRVTRIFINPVTDPGADQGIRILSEDTGLTSADVGTVTSTVGNGNVTEIEVPHGYEQSYCRAGRSFAVTTDGSGAVSSTGGVVVELYPA